MSKLHSRRIWAPFLVLCALFLCLPAPAFAADGYPSSITAFDVDITVGDDNVYRVVNTIDMKFAPDSYSHGLYMTLELDPYVFFEQDGEYYSREYRINVSDLEIEGGPFETDREDGTLTIRIGDPDELVDGRTLRYTISYNYAVGEDGFPDFDMFYYAIIGNSWSQTIDNITFAVHMPKEFDPDVVGFSVGGYGAEGYDPARLHFAVDGTDITGSYVGQLDAYEGIWIRLALPDGYYENVYVPEPAPALPWVCAALAGGVFVLWAVFRARTRPVVTVEFGPPEGLNSADVGCIADGHADVRDIMSLLIWWASKGFLKIVQMAPDPGKKKKKKGLLLVRLADLPDDADEYQRILFEKIFEDDDRVAVHDLRYKVSGTVSKAVSLLERKFSRGDDQIYTTRSKALSLVCTFLSAVPPALMLAAWAWVESFYDTLVVVPAVIFIYVFFLLLAFVYRVFAFRRHALKKSGRVLSIIFVTLFIAVSAAFAAAGSCAVYGPTGLTVLVFVPMLLAAPSLRTYTEKGLRWQGQILGLRRFIERAEKDRLEMLVSEHPEYFYDILPFAYVLGVTDVWARQFEEIAVPDPTWYVGTDMNTFTTVYLVNSLSQNLERAQGDLTAVRGGGSSGGGGGFSGGGFSGGGFGGSGGGSW
ncbi:MAG: DUF2207 domain-containing protein [Clostridia bacterium]|nr:DUF2207 domain-containing protein [Clostridia bacterium]